MCGHSNSVTVHLLFIHMNANLYCDNNEWRVKFRVGNSKTFTDNIISNELNYICIGINIGGFDYISYWNIS